MDLRIKGRIAVVTAGSQGLGKATALRLAQEGANVAICARGEEALRTAVKEIESAGGSAMGQSVDLLDANSISAFANSVSEELGAADILINNAGGPPPGKFDEVTNDDWDKAYKLTLMSAVNATRAFLPAMREKKWGRIINIASYSIKQPIPQLLLSNSMRMGVLGWAKSISLDLAAEGITVNTVCPGWVSTDRVGDIVAAQAKIRDISEDDVMQEIIGQIPAGRMGTPEEIGDLVAFLASDLAGYITGVAIQADGGIVKGPY